MSKKKKEKRRKKKKEAVWKVERTKEGWLQYGLLTHFAVSHFMYIKKKKKVFSVT